MTFKYNLNKDYIELVSIENEKIFIYDLYYLGEYTNCIIYKATLISINCEDLDEIVDLTEATAKIRLNSKKNINLSGEDIIFTLKGTGKFTINNKYIKLKKGYFKEYEAISSILKMMEVLSIILGEFPELEYFELKSFSKGTIRKYFEVNGVLNTDLFFSFNNKRIVDLVYFDGEKLKEVFVKYCELIKNDDIQLRTYFIAQSELTRYSDYLLSYLIQAIEGISRFAFNDEIREYINKKRIISDLKKKSVKNISIEEINDEDLKYREALNRVKKYVENNFSGSILNRLKGFFKYNENSMTLDNVLQFWLEKDEFVRNIFKDEIIRDKSCKIYIQKDTLVDISTNERNRIAHSMKNAENKKYFSSKERKLYIKKYTIMFRYLVLKFIGITLTDEIKILNLERLNNSTKKRCKKCSNVNCYFQN